jgi:Tfp pilus assembly protein PilV
LIISTAKAQRRALVILVLTLLLAGSRYVSESWAAGSLAVGKCGAYGQAFDYPAEDAARIAALKQCKGQCTAVTMKRACAALAIDLKNPCGAHGYAVKAKISSTLNAATRKCYEFGGKECVIRAWACDARG